jgi:23S rRNA (cytosine1962-C5)-methyltransferase
MIIANNWREYALIDAGDGMKLERWGEAVLARPEPQAVWPRQTPERWASADAVYHRSQTGGGEWTFARPLPALWEVRYHDLCFGVRPTGFKHTGLFPEQAVNWDFMRARIEAAKAPVRVLNLFAYTGGATLACARAGAQVVHVDAAKGMVAWAQDNAKRSGLADAPIRYIVDDALKFVLREGRRGRRYDGIVMDPPSYGRGPGGEMFRFEADAYPLLEACVKLLSDNPLFFVLNSYTAGFAPDISANMLRCALKGGEVFSENIGLGMPSGMALPCGAVARWTP